MFVFLYVGLVLGALGIDGLGSNSQTARSRQSPMQVVGPVALSPDGRHLVYVGRHGSHHQLYLRRMDLAESKPLPGTEGANDAFFSPDGRWVGFFAAKELKKVAVSHGQPQTLCPAVGSRGASWGPDGTIVFAPGISGNSLWRVSAAGGAAQIVAMPDVEKGERSYRWPEVLPGGKAVLFTIEVAGKPFDEALIAVLSLETGERRVVLEGGSDAHYALTGHLVYVRAGRLFAAPFDLGQFRVTGPSVAVAEDVGGYSVTGEGFFSHSRNGVLVYVRASTRPGGALVWVSRTGEERPMTSVRRQYSSPQLSPDGRRLAVSISYEDIWLYDLERDTFTRLTFDRASNVYPLWTPDGKHVTFSSDKGGGWNIFWKRADGSGGEERITTSGNPQFTLSWSPDGKVLAFYEANPTTAGDIWVLPMEGRREPQPFLQTSAVEGPATFSPDGRWIAYASNETGRFEVYLRPYPGPGSKRQISTDGGTGPRWARNGPDLFYRWADKMMAVCVATEPQLVVGKPRMLFEREYDFEPGYGNYDVTADGQRFVMVKKPEPAPLEKQWRVLPNWFEELKRRVRRSKN